MKVTKLAGGPRLRKQGQQPLGWKEAALARCAARGGHSYTSKRNGVPNCSWCGKSIEDGER